MEGAKLRRRVSAILNEEERPEIDWAQIAELSSELDRELAAESYLDCPDVVLHYLDDDDVRARDQVFAARQRDEIRRYIETGEYRDGKPLPWWTWLLLLASSIGVLIWLLI